MKETALEKQIRYRDYFKHSIGRYAFIKHMKKGNKFLINTYERGLIYNLTSEFVIIKVNDEHEIKIRYSTILNTTFLDSHNEIKYKLYYKHS